MCSYINFVIRISHLTAWWSIDWKNISRWPRADSWAVLVMGQQYKHLALVYHLKSHQFLKCCTNTKTSEFRRLLYLLNRTGVGCFAGCNNVKYLFAFRNAMLLVVLSGRALKSQRITFWVLEFSVRLAHPEHHSCLLLQSNWNKFGILSYSSRCLTIRLSVRVNFRNSVRAPTTQVTPQ